MRRSWAALLGWVMPGVRGATKAARIAQVSLDVFHAGHVFRRAPRKAQDSPAALDQVLRQSASDDTAHADNQCRSIHRPLLLVHSSGKCMLRNPAAVQN